jgi:hypothetical protein
MVTTMDFKWDERRQGGVVFSQTVPMFRLQRLLQQAIAATDAAADDLDS